MTEKAKKDAKEKTLNIQEATICEATAQMLGKGGKRWR